MSTFRCRGYASPYGPCGASDCADCGSGVDPNGDPEPEFDDEAARPLVDDYGCDDDGDDDGDLNAEVPW